MNMSLKDSLYHSLLRMAALTAALTLLFVSGIITPITKELTLTTQVYLANAVGASAGVEPTDLNQITAALTIDRIALEKREAAVAERELLVGLNQSTNASTIDLATVLNSVFLFVIVLLILLNYLLDFAYRRQKNIDAAVHNTTTTVTG